MGAKQLSIEEKELIIKLHTVENKHTVEIAKLINRNQSAVERFLKKENLFKKHSKIIIKDPEQIEQVCRWYIDDNLTTVEIGKLLGVTDHTVADTLRRAKVTVSTDKYLKCQNRSYFNTIDTELKAYFLGYFITDGNVGIPTNKPNSRIVQMCLASKDRYILEKLAEELHISKDKIQDTTRTKSNKTYYESSIQLSSTEMFNALNQHGVVPRKTHNTKLPKLSDELMPHLLRGIFDGDGCARNGYFKWCGSYNFLSEIKEFLRSLGCIAPMTISKGTCYSIQLSNRHDRSLLYKYLYTNSSFCLERKKSLIEKYL